jgi:predicted nucleic acid-binding protein
VSEDGGVALPAYVLDVSVLAEVARGDRGTMILLQELDARGRPLILPALAITGASLDMPGDEAGELLEGTGRLEGAFTAPVRDAGQALALAAVISKTRLDPWDAHTAAVADASITAILTLDGAKWRRHAHDLDEPLHFIEIADPGDG